MLTTLHFAITCILIGLIWTIQLVKYPGFRYVSERDFISYHDHHSRSISYLVAPLMFSELGLAAWLAWDNGWAVQELVPLLIVVAIWLSTVLLQIPQHQILSEGKNDRAIDRLVHSNWIRTVLWTGKGIWMLDLTG